MHAGLASMNDFGGRSSMMGSVDSSDNGSGFLIGKNNYGGYEHLILNGANYFQDCIVSHHQRSSRQHIADKDSVYENNNISEITPAM